MTLQVLCNVACATAIKQGIDRFKPNNPESYANWSLILLVVPLMPDRSKGRGQQKVILWPSRLGVWHRANNPVKKHTVTETAAEDKTTTVCHALSESPQCMSSLHWNKQEGVSCTPNGRNTLP